MKLIVHAGTGTIIPMDECVVVTLHDEDLEDAGTGTHLTDEEIVDRAVSIGKQVNSTDLSWRNTIAFSPTALREEAGELLNDYADNDHITKALLWCVNVATDDELNDVALWILDADELWSLFRSSVIDGLIQGLAWSEETS